MVDQMRESTIILKMWRKWNKISSTPRIVRNPNDFWPNRIWIYTSHPITATSKRLLDKTAKRTLDFRPCQQLQSRTSAEIITAHHHWKPLWRSNLQSCPTVHSISQQELSRWNPGLLAGHSRERCWSSAIIRGTKSCSLLYNQEIHCGMRTAGMVSSAYTDQRIKSTTAHTWSSITPEVVHVTNIQTKSVLRTSTVH